MLALPLVLCLLAPSSAPSSTSFERVLERLAPERVLRSDDDTLLVVDDVRFEITVESNLNRTFLSIDDRKIEVEDSACADFDPSDLNEFLALARVFSRSDERGPMRLERSLVAHWALVDDDTLILREGVVRPEALEPLELGNELDTFLAFFESFLSVASRSSLGRDSKLALAAHAEKEWLPALRSVRSVLEQIETSLASTVAVRPHTIVDEELDEFLHVVSFFDDDGPSLVQLDSIDLLRRWLRRGWGAQVLETKTPEPLPVRRALRDAERSRLVRRWSGESVTLDLRVSDFGEISVLLSSPTRWVHVSPGRRVESYIVESDPKFASSLCQRVELDHRPVPGPSLPDETLERAHIALFSNGAEICAWDPTLGFRFDFEKWRRVYPDWTEGVDGNDEYLPRQCPPHLSHVDQRGVVRSLHTEHGMVRFPTDPAALDTDSLIEKLAIALPDAAHLDAFVHGHCTYVHDSPDYDRPHLIGHEPYVGDVHRRAPDLFESRCGGMFHGDCDDYVELLLQITRRQGKKSHVIDLPGHVALCWLEKNDSETPWTAYVVDTGWGRRFEGDSPEKVLVSAYGSSGDAVALSADALPISIRIGGENQMTPYLLGHRVFTDEAYARTLIPAQEDWYRSTYHNALQNVAPLQMQYADDVALAREIASLFAQCGDYESARASLERVLLDGSLPGRSRTKLIGNLLAWLDPKARQLRFRELRTLFEELERDERRERIQDLFDYASASPEVSEFVLDLGAGTAKQLTGLYLYVGAESLRALEDETFEKYRTYCSMYASLGLSLFQQRNWSPKEGQRERILEAIGLWLEVGAFLHIEGLGLSRQYSLLGNYYRLAEGPSFHADVMTAELPSEPRQHARRFGSSRRALDVRWISASTEYWLDELWLAVRRGAPPEELDVVLTRMKAAGAWARDAGHASPYDGVRETWGELIVASVTDADPDRIEGALRQLAEGADLYQRGAIANLMTECGRHVPSEKFEALFRSWERVFGEKWLYFGIARALGAREKTEPLARVVLERIRSRFAEDEVFIAEAEFIEDIWLPRMRAREEARHKRASDESPALEPSSAERE